MNVVANDILNFLNLDFTSFIVISIVAIILILIFRR